MTAYRVNAYSAPAESPMPYASYTLVWHHDPTPCLPYGCECEECVVRRANDALLMASWEGASLDAGNWSLP
jgi:hypothetical protein